MDVRADTLNLRKISALTEVNVVHQTPLFLVSDMPSNSGANLGVVQSRGKHVTQRTQLVRCKLRSTNTYA
jgi:exonuclease I